MKVTILTKNIKLTPALKYFTESKINDLEKFSGILNRDYFGGEADKTNLLYFDEYYGKGKPRTEAWVEISKTTRHHKKGPFFRAECQLRLPGKSLRAEAEKERLKLAIVEVKDELQRQLKQYKEKIAEKQKKRLRNFKEKGV